MLPCTAVYAVRKSCFSCGRVLAHDVGVSPPPLRGYGSLLSSGSCPYALGPGKHSLLHLQLPLIIPFVPRMIRLKIRHGCPPPTPKCHECLAVSEIAPPFDAFSTCAIQRRILFCVPAVLPHVTRCCSGAMVSKRIWYASVKNTNIMT